MFGIGEEEKQNDPFADYYKGLDNKEGTGTSDPFEGFYGKPKKGFMDKVSDTAAKLAPEGFKDIPTAFTHGLTYGYAPQVQTPEDAGVVHKVATGIAGLTGMMAGLAPAIPFLPEEAAGWETILAANAALGAFHGAVRKPEEGETRGQNLLDDAAWFGAFAGGGKLASEIAGKLAPETAGRVLNKLKNNFEFNKLNKEHTMPVEGQNIPKNPESAKILSDWQKAHVDAEGKPTFGPLTAEEASIHNAIQYASSAALMGGAGATQPAKDWQDRAEHILEGMAVGAGIHGIMGMLRSDPLSQSIDQEMDKQSDMKDLIAVPPIEKPPGSEGYWNDFFNQFRPKGPQEGPGFTYGDTPRPAPEPPKEPWKNLKPADAKDLKSLRARAEEEGWLPEYMSAVAGVHPDLSGTTMARAGKIAAALGLRFKPEELWPKGKPGSYGMGSKEEAPKPKAEPKKAPSKAQPKPEPKQAGFGLDETVKPGEKVVDAEMQDINAQAHEAAASPTNKEPEPTPAQAEAGNYKKGHVDFQGLDISIENPAGSVRKGVDEHGNAWEQELSDHYGYIKGTVGKDKDHLDVFIPPDGNPKSDKAFIVDQKDPISGNFDEHKIMLGYDTKAKARQGYLDNYDESGKNRIMNITEMPMDKFKDWIKDGDMKKPAAQYVQKATGIGGQTERREDTKTRKKVSDMTPQERYEALFLDHLTGLKSQRAYEEAERKPFQASIDIDGLKKVNDTYGHKAGDKLLERVGQALNLASGDASGKEKFATPYRFHGDEFALEGTSRKDLEQVVAKAKELLKGNPLKFEGKEIVPDFSHGIGANMEEADKAMLVAKKARGQGRGSEKPQAKPQVKPQAQTKGGLLRKVAAKQAEAKEVPKPKVVKAKGKAKLFTNVIKDHKDVFMEDTPQRYALDRIAEKGLKTVKNDAGKQVIPGHSYTDTKELRGILRGVSAGFNQKHKISGGLSEKGGVWLSKLAQEMNEANIGARGMDEETLFNMLMGHETFDKNNLNDILKKEQEYYDFLKDEKPEEVRETVGDLEKSLEAEGYSPEQIKDAIRELEDDRAAIQEEANSAEAVTPNTPIKEPTVITPEKPKFSPVDALREAIEKNPTQIKYEKQIADNNGQTVTIPAPARVGFEARLTSEITKPTDEFGGKVTSEGKIGKAIFKIQRPYGELIYNEATGEISAYFAPETSASAKDVTEEYSAEAPLEADKTLLFQTLSKDIINNDLSGTIANETIQNSLDAFSGFAVDSKNIDIVINSDYSGDIAETVLKVTDNGKGMTNKEVRDFLLKVGSKGKSGTDTSGGYGLAKAAVLLAPRNLVMTTVRDGMQTVLTGTKEQFFGFEGAGVPQIPKSTPTDKPNGTTFELHFYMHSSEAKQDNSFAMTATDASRAFTKYVEHGLFVNNANLSITTNGSKDTFTPKPPDELEQVLPSQKLNILGNKIKVYFVPSKEKVYRNWDKKFHPYVDTLNKGMRLFGVQSSEYGVNGLFEEPKWRIMVNFEQTPEVTDINYPFISNRTKMTFDIAKQVREIIDERIADINEDTFNANKKDFTEMIKLSPTINGVRVLIPFKDQGEIDKTTALIEGNKELVSGLSDLFNSFQAIIAKTGGKEINLVMTVDPKVFGFRSNPTSTGIELYAINPFSVTNFLLVSEEYKRMVNTGYDNLTAMASNLVHTFVHEYVHDTEPDHYEGFTAQLGRTYMQMTHAQLARLEGEAREFYEKHGEQLGRLQSDFEGMGKGGTRLSKDSSVVYPSRIEPGGARGGPRDEEMGKILGEAPRSIKDRISSNDTPLSMVDEAKNVLAEFNEDGTELNDWLRGDIETNLGGGAAGAKAEVKALKAFIAKYEPKANERFEKALSKVEELKQKIAAKKEENAALPGLSPEETFQLTPKETAIGGKLEEKVQKKPEQQTLFSGIDPTQTVNILRSLRDNIKDAIPHLQDLGRAAFNEAKEKMGWFAKMKEWLGKLWEDFKHLMEPVWSIVSNERGAIRNPFYREGEKNASNDKINEQIRSYAEKLKGADAYKNAADVFGNIYEGMKRTFYPGALSAEAEKVAGLLTEQMGKGFIRVAQLKGRLNAVVDKYRRDTSFVARLLDEMQTSTGVLADKVFNKMSKADQHDFIGRIQSGQKQKNAQLDEFAGVLTKMFDDLWEAANKAVPGATRYRPNYFPGMWENPKGAEKFFSQWSKNFEGSKAHTKAKVFDDIYAGIAAGFTPRGTPLDMAFEKLSDMQKYINAHTVLKQMLEDGTAVLVKAGNKAPAGYKLIPEPYGVITKRMRMGPNGFETASYRYAAKEEVSQVIENYLSRSLYDSPYVGQLWKGYMGAANTLNQFQLGVGSAFHAGFTTMEAVISHFALGIKAAAEGDYKSAAKFFRDAPMKAYKTPMFGDEIIKAYRLGAQNAEMARIIGWLEMAGAREHMDMRLRTSTTEEMLKDWESGKHVPAALRSPFAFVEQLTRPVMEWLVPRQKFGVFSEMANDWYSKNEAMLRNNPNAHEITRRQMQYFWNRVDSRMGQVVYERLFARNVAKNIAQGLIRAPGWTGGTLVEIGGGVADFGKVFRDVFNGKKPQMTDKMAYTMSLLVLTGTINAIMTKLLTGDDPKDSRDLLAFRTGKLDERGNPERMLLPTYAKDIYAWMNKPGQTLFNKTHPIISTMIDIAKNKDYYGTEIRNRDSNAAAQLLQTGEFGLKQFIPFYMRGMKKISEHGGSMASTLPTLVGIMPATSELGQTKAQSVMSNIINEREKATMTQAQAERNHLKRQIERQIRNKDEGVNQTIQGLVSEGKLSRRDVIMARQGARIPYMEKEFKILSLQEAMRVYEAANKDEEKEFRPFLLRKMHLLNNLPDQEKEETVTKLRDLLRR